MTTVEIVDAILRFMVIILSWETLFIVFLFLFRHEIKDILKISNRCIKKLKEYPAKYKKIAGIELEVATLSSKMENNAVLYYSC